MSRVSVGALLLIVTAALGCDVLLVEPAPVVPSLSVSLSAPSAVNSSYGDLGGALAAIRTARFRFIHEGVERDTVVAALVEDTTVRVRVLLRPDEARGWLEVHADLLGTGGQPLFRGLTLLRALTSTVTVELAPVAVSVTGLIPMTFSSLGDTVVPNVEVRMATGYPLQGVPVVWESDAPTILEIVDGSKLVSRSNGVATVTANSMGATTEWQMTVRQTPYRFDGVAPDTTVALGETFLARAYGEDANGYPLLPGAAVTWSARGYVTVDPAGRVRANSVGAGWVDGTVGSTVRSAEVTITP